MKGSRIMNEIFASNLKDLYFNLATYIQFVVENVAFAYLTELVSQGKIVEDYENCKKRLNIIIHKLMVVMTQ